MPTSTSTKIEKFQENLHTIGGLADALMKRAQELLWSPEPDLPKVQGLLTEHRKLTADADLLHMACFGDGETPKDGWERHTRELETMGHRAELALLQAEGKDARRKKDALRKSNERLAREVQEGTQEAVGITARLVVQNAKDSEAERARRAAAKAATLADKEDSARRDAASRVQEAEIVYEAAPKRRGELVGYQREIRQQWCMKGVWDDVLLLVAAQANKVYQGDLLEDVRMIVSPPDVQPKVEIRVDGASRLEGTSPLSFKLLDMAKQQLLREHTLQDHREGFVEREECLLVNLDVAAIERQWNVSGNSDPHYEQIRRDFNAFAQVMLSARVGRYMRTFQFVTEPELKNGILRFWIGHNYAELLRRGDGHGNFRNPQVVTLPRSVYTIPDKADWLLAMALCKAQDAGPRSKRKNGTLPRARVLLLLERMGAETATAYKRRQEDGGTLSKRTWHMAVQRPFEAAVRRLVENGFLRSASYLVCDYRGHVQRPEMGHKFWRPSEFEGAMLEFEVTYVPTEFEAFRREMRKRRRKGGKDVPALVNAG